MSAKPSFSLGRALSASVASLPAALGGAWLVLILMWAVITFGLPFVVSADLHVVQGHPYGGMSARFPLLIGLGLLLFVLSLAAKGAVYRAILFGKTAGKEGLGFGGLQFGLPELRLLVSDILVSLFILVIWAAFFIVLAVALTTTGQAHGYPNSFAAIHALFRRHQGSDWVFIIYIIGALIFMLFLGVRFVLRHAATIAERRIVALNALGLSSGNVGKLFIGLIVILIPIHVVVGALMHLIAHHRISAFLHTDHHLYGPGFWLRAAVHALLIGVAAPLTAGFLASAYRQIVDLRAK